MKKRYLMILSMLLTVCLLCSCSTVPAALSDLFSHEREDYAVREICRFEDMPYERPDLKTMRDKAAEIEKALADGMRFRKVTGLLDELFAMYNTADTMITIADIRNCQDLTDEYYAAEYAWCAAAQAEISQIMEQVYLACGSSQYGERLEEEYFWEGFLEDYGPESEGMLTDEYVALSAEESELIAQYRSLVGNPTIEIGGEEWFLDDWIYNAENDQEVMLGYNAFYNKYNPVLGEIYLRLVQLRKEEAEVLGYDSFAGMQFELGYGRDFTVEESDRFIDCVRELLVPLYEKLEQSGVRESIWYSVVDEQDLEDILETVSYVLGDEAWEAYEFMKKYELFDLRISNDKPDMSFQTYLSDYEAPFLFMNPYGSSEDVLTVTHEYGHYVESFASFNTYRTMDLAECFSQAMQYLALEPMKELFADEEVENFLRMNLIDTLDTYVQQASFAAFERAVFEMQDPSVEKLNALSLELAKEYGYYDGVNADYYAKSWIDIPHFFEQPFYVISYPVSAGIALEIYELELDKPGAGFDKYLELAETEESGLISAADEAKLQNPLSADRVREIAGFLERELIGTSTNQAAA